MRSFVVLVHDEMKIKSDLVYQKLTGPLVGFVDLSNFQNKLCAFQDEINQTTAPEHNLARHMFEIMVQGLFATLRTHLPIFQHLAQRQMKFLN